MKIISINSNNEYYENVETDSGNFVRYHTGGWYAMDGLYKPISADRRAVELSDKLEKLYQEFMPRAEE